MNEPVVDTDNTFSPKYRETLKEIEKDGNCPAPFCKDEAPYHTHPIELKLKYWKITRNSFNYQNAKHAFLLVLNEHEVNFPNISREAFAELQDTINYLIETYDLEGYTLLWRMGDSEHTGASVQHLHAHLVCGYKRPNKPKEEMTDKDYIMALIGFAKQ